MDCPGKIPHFKVGYPVKFKKEDFIGWAEEEKNGRKRDFMVKYYATKK
jgi:hypothetical protein